MWTIFKSLHWICYNVISVLCFWFFGCEVWGILASDGLNLNNSALEGKSKTPDSPGKSLHTGLQVTYYMADSFITFGSHFKCQPLCTRIPRVPPQPYPPPTKATLLHHLLFISFTVLIWEKNVIHIRTCVLCVLSWLNVVFQEIGSPCLPTCL